MKRRRKRLKREEEFKFFLGLFIIIISNLEMQAGVFFEFSDIYLFSFLVVVVGGLEFFLAHNKHYLHK